MTGLQQQAEDTVVAAAAFYDKSRAEQALQALQAAGFEDDQFGVAVREESVHVDHEWRRSRENQASVDAASGVAAGGLIGGLVGAGLALAIPGVGPAIAVGIIGTTIAGGAYAGSLAGPLISLGMTEQEAEFLDSAFQDGAIIISVETDEAERRDLAQQILRDQGGRDESTTVD